MCREARVGTQRPAGDSRWDSTVTLKRVVNCKSLIKGRPEKNLVGWMSDVRE